MMRILLLFCQMIATTAIPALIASTQQMGQSAIVDSLSAHYYVPETLKSMVETRRSFNMALRLTEPDTNRLPSMLVLKLTESRLCTLTIVDRFTDGSDCQGSVQTIDNDSVRIAFDDCEVAQIALRSYQSRHLLARLYGRSMWDRYSSVACGRRQFENWIDSVVIRGAYRHYSVGDVLFESQQVSVNGARLTTYTVRPEQNELGLDIIEFDDAFPGTSSSLFAIDREKGQLLLIPISFAEGSYVVNRLDDVLTFEPMNK